MSDPCPAARNEQWILRTSAEGLATGGARRSAECPEWVESGPSINVWNGWKADVTQSTFGAGLHARHLVVGASLCRAVEDYVMPWQRVREVSPPIDRPVLIRTTEDEDPVIAFLTADNVWYSGGALVQNSVTVLGAIPTEWCEPDGEERL